MYFWKIKVSYINTCMSKINPEIIEDLKEKIRAEFNVKEMYDFYKYLVEDIDIGEFSTPETIKLTSMEI